jgi:hypothetical protein
LDRRWEHRLFAVPRDGPGLDGLLERTHGGRVGLANSCDVGDRLAVGGHFDHFTGLGAGEPLGKMGLKVPNGHPTCDYICHGFACQCDHFSLLLPVRRRTIPRPPGRINTASPTTHGIGKLENLDPAPSNWVEPEEPMESFGFEDWPAVVYAD